jgi:hypothetical protein
MNPTPPRPAEACPWCEGGLWSRGALIDRLHGKPLEECADRIVCPFCDGTGAADSWHGPAAEDWRRRRAMTLTEWLCGATPTPVGRWGPFGAPAGEEAR